jgi:hypothetical protein
VRDFVQTAARYRTVPEASIIELLLAGVWPFEARDDRRATAEREARETLDRWVAMGLAHGCSTDGERLFDSVEIANFLSWAGARHGDPAWGRSVATLRRAVLEFHRESLGSAIPPSPAELGPGRFSVTLMREFNLADMPVGARVRLRLPAPIEDEALSELALTPFARDGLEPNYTLAPGRLDAQIVAPPDRCAVVGFTATFVARSTRTTGTPVPLTAAERELYTRPREGVIQTTPRIRALAAQLADGDDDDWSVVGRFWRHLSERLLTGAVHYDQAGRAAPLDWALDHGWVDCQLGSALIAALCRARGIPARQISGYLLYPVSPAPHYWLEVWTSDRGWVPVDLSSWDLAAGDARTGWRDHFFDAIDYRMKTQVLPRLFSDGAVRFPSSWRMLRRIRGEGVEISYHDNDTGGLIHRDQISVRRVDGPHARPA